MTNDHTGYNAMLDANAEARLVSARAVLSHIFKIFSPRSVLDVGCGHGAWLRVARELGADEIQGADGEWIDPAGLMIPQDYFVHHDLETALSLGHTFDLVLSLEVAEHLSEQAADTFVDSLTRHGDIILFSAAIPFQGGRGHVNEQWPGYWAAKFAQRGYATVDMIRRPMWTDDSVFWWLRQNTIVYINRDRLSEFPECTPSVVSDLDSLAQVHPDLYFRWVRQGLAQR